MIYRFPIKTVRDMLLNQISNNYFKSIEDELLISKHLPKALERFEACIRENDNKYYYRINNNGAREPYFDPLHTCQWALFLYLIANTIYKNEDEKKDAGRVVCDKIYGQLKIVSGCDLFYEVDMPTVFKFDHPTGTYIGRATFGDGFSFTHNCTVGPVDGIYPIIGNNVCMNAASKVLGSSIIGDNCILMEGTMIIGETIPDNSVVSGITPNLIISAKD